MGESWQIVPQTSGGITEERSENVSLDVMSGKERQRWRKEESLTIVFDANEILFGITEEIVSNENNFEL